MNLLKCYLTANDCYKRGTTITPKGVMVHSTAANNTAIKRYVNPLKTDKDYADLIKVIGKNSYSNHWNRKGLQKCVHAFIGTLADGTVATVQTLPWNRRGWHCGSGKKGSGNDSYISFEICEDNTKGAAYFKNVYKEAVELTAMLCNLYKLDPLKDGVVICHSEGYKRGIASNHSDVMHWLPKHGKSMDTFRKDVAAAMKGQVEEPAKEEVKEPVSNGIKLDYPKSFSKSYDKTYKVTPSNGLNMRAGAGTGKTKITALKKGAKFRCYGYYTKVDGTVWLYGVSGNYKGFCSKDYLK